MATKRRTTPVRLREPVTVPMTPEQYEQAVSALSVMILDWWRSQARDQKPEQLADESVVEDVSLPQADPLRTCNLA